MHRKKFMVYAIIGAITMNTFMPSISVYATSTNNSVSAIEISNGVDEKDLTVTSDNTDDETIEVSESAIQEESEESIEETEAYPVSCRSFFCYQLNDKSQEEILQYLAALVQVSRCSNINVLKSIYVYTAKEPQPGDLIYQNGKYKFYLGQNETVSFSYPLNTEEIETYIPDETDKIYTYKNNKGEIRFRTMEAMTYEEMVDEIVQDYVDDLTDEEFALQKTEILQNIVTNEYQNVIEENYTLIPGDVVSIANELYIYIASEQAMRVEVNDQKEVSHTILEMNLQELLATPEITSSIYTYVKQDYTYIVPTPTSVYHAQLSEVILPDGFTWDQPNITIGKVGEVTFTATYTPLNSIKYNTVTNVPITVNVSPRVITELEAPVITETFVYDPNRTLADITLPVDWEWVNPTENPKPNKTDYEVKFNPAYPEGYDIQIDNLETTVKLTIEKAVIDISPLSYTIAAEKSTDDIELPTSDLGVYTWNEQKTFYDKGTYTVYVTFTPNDTDCYETITDIVVTIVVDKEVEVDIPQNITATYNQTLSEIALPSGWTWVNSSQKVGDVGENTAYAAYKGNTYAVPIKVNPARATSPDSPESVVVVWTKGMSLDTIEIPQGWEFNDGQTMQMGTHSYRVTYTPSDTKNYDWSCANLTSAITVNVKQAVPNYKSPGTISVTSGSTLKNNLLPVSDEGTYTWTSDTSKKITSNGTYYCKFTPVDTEHYYIVTDIAVVVTVIKNSTTSNNNNTSSDTSSASTADTTSKTTKTNSNNTSVSTNDTTEDNKKTMDDVKIVANAEDNREYKVRPVSVDDTTESTEEIINPPVTKQVVNEEESTEAPQDPSANDKEREESSSPIGWILILVIITGAAIGVAMYYKKKNDDGNINLISEGEE